MTSAGTGELPETDAGVPPHEWLLRLNFNPEHVVNGEVIPTAVSLSDLRSRGYSIDREVMLDLAVIVGRATVQAEKKPEERKEPFLSRFECGPVRLEVAIPEAHPAFLVEASPVEGSDTQPANPAHAHIKSAIARPDSGLRRLRSLLLPHLQRLVALDEYVKGRQPVADLPPSAESPA